MKKSFINFLESRIVNPKKHNYFFYRWLIELFIDKSEIKNVFFQIANYFTNQYSLSSYDFSDIFVLNNKVYIYTRTPGCWIGKGGKELTKLENCINYTYDGETKLHDYQVRIIEDRESSRYSIYDTYYVLSKFN